MGILLERKERVAIRLAMTVFTMPELFYLFLTTTLWDRYYSYSHFTDEKTESCRLTNGPKKQSWNLNLGLYGIKGLALNHCATYLPSLVSFLLWSDNSFLQSLHEGVGGRHSKAGRRTEAKAALSGPQNSGLHRKEVRAGSDMEFHSEMHVTGTWQPAPALSRREVSAFGLQIPQPLPLSGTISSLVEPRPPFRCPLPCALSPYSRKHPLPVSLHLSLTL